MSMLSLVQQQREILHSINCNTCNGNDDEDKEEEEEEDLICQCLVLFCTTNDSNTATLLNKTQRFNMKMFSSHYPGSFFLLGWVGGGFYPQYPGFLLF